MLLREENLQSVPAENQRPGVLPKSSQRGSEERGMIPEAAIWRGKPTQERINRIKALTMADTHGRVYWRQETWEPWRRLRGVGEYEALNKTLEIK